MKRILLICSLLISSTTLTVKAQFSGVIQYEVIKKAQFNRMVEGNVAMPPPPPDGMDVPESISFSQKLIVDQHYAREDKDMPGPVIRRLNPPNSPKAEQVRRGKPFTEKDYIDIKQRKYLRYLEIEKDGTTQTYRTEEDFEEPTEWSESGKTKKICGYICKKAVCKLNGVDFTVWYTDELPITYSPLNGVVPPRGVVMLLESEDQYYKAVSVDKAPANSDEIKPIENAIEVDAEQLRKLKQKAMADFQQKMFSRPFPGE